MGLSLSDAAVRGMSTSSTLTDEKRELLDRGDVAGLIRLNRATFGNFVMEGEDDADDNDDESDEDEDDDDDSDDDDEDDESEDKKDPKDPKDKRIHELSQESANRRVTIREQRKRIKELETQLQGKAEKPKGKGDDEDEDKSSEELAEVRTTAEKLARANEDLLIRLEFTNMVSGDDAKYQFKNPKTALRVLDLSDVDITDDGEVDGLEEAIAKLAKSDPYLLADKGDDDGKKRRTGQPTNNGRKNKGNPNREKLINKYPALRR